MTEIISVVRDIFSQLIGVSEEALSSQISFLELGADSFILVAASRRMEEKWQVKISVRELFETYSSIEKVTARVQSLLSPLQEALKSEEIFNEIAETLKNLVADILGIAVSELDVEKSFLEMGADSFLLVLLSRRLKERFSTNVNVRDLFQEFNTVKKLELHISKQSTTRNISAPNLKTDDLPREKSLNLDSASLNSKANSLSESAMLPAANLTVSQRLHIQLLTEKYSARTKSSKQRAEDSRKLICNNRRSSSGFRSETKEMYYPIIGVGASGSYIEDVDGRQYIDLSMSYGATLFGHNPPFLREPLRRVLDGGFQVGPEATDAIDVARLVAELTGFPRVLFSNSGTEAVMTAIRVARAATSRKLIVFFQNSYHGHADVTLVDANPDRLTGPATPQVPGVTSGSAADTLVLPYDSTKSLEILRSYAREIAAIVVEPVQNRRPDLHPGSFLRDLRRIADDGGAALIFDEVLVGFRIASGGAQQHFGVRADIAAYGKIVGGGLPIGIVAGESWCMDAVDGGEWSFGDKSAPFAGTTFTAGTFCKHPLAMVAAKATLEEIVKQKDFLYTQLNEKSEKFFRQVDELFKYFKVPLSIARFGSFFRFAQSGNLSFTHQPLELDLFFFHLILGGVYVWEGKTCFISTAHGEKELNQIVVVIKEAVSELTSAGFWRSDEEITDSNSCTLIPHYKPLVGTGYTPTKVPQGAINFSLYFFGDYGNCTGKEAYNTLLDFSAFAENNNFTAIWTPERHFNSFGGFSPNAALLSSAVARSTSKLSIRASVVPSLHHPARLVEEWSVVDHMAGGGRVGLAFAPGWHSNDFVLAPLNWADRKSGMESRIGLIQQLWRGDQIGLPGVGGKETKIEIFPKPTIPTLPLWLTTLSDRTVFERAGEWGLGILTNLLDQSIEQLEINIQAYESARSRAGLDPKSGSVVVLMHTFILKPDEDLMAIAFRPFCNYISSSIDLFQNMHIINELTTDIGGIEDADKQFIIEQAALKLLDGRALIGSVEKCEKVVRSLKKVGASEVACFVDFGIDAQCVEEHFPRLLELKEICEKPSDFIASLTSDQQQLLALEQFYPDSLGLNGQQFIAFIPGLFDFNALESAYLSLIEEHEVLRALVDDAACTQTFRSYQPSDIDIIWIDQNDELLSNEVEYLVNLESMNPLSTKLLHRLTCLASVNEGFFISFNIHHVICDGVGAAHLLEQLVHRYIAIVFGNPIVRPSVLPYSEFLIAMGFFEKTNNYARQCDYWRNVLNDGLPVIAMPRDYPIPLSPSADADSVSFQINGEVLRRLRINAKTLNVTDFVVMLACYFVFLSRVTGRAHISISVPFDGRSIGQGKHVVGNCVTVLPILITVNESDTLANVARSVSDALFFAYEHQDVRLSDIIKLLDSSEVANDNTRLSSTVFAWDKVRLPDGCEVVPLKRRFCKSNFGLEATDIGHALLVEFVYRLDAFSKGTAHSFSEILERICTAFSRTDGLDISVADVNIVSDAQYSLLMKEWQENVVLSDIDQCFHNRFEYIAAKEPDLTCLVWQGSETSYHYINSQANRVAHALLSSGACAGDRIGVCLPRSFNQIIAILGVMKMGGAYVPIDPEYPLGRKIFFIQESKMSALVTDSISISPLMGSISASLINLLLDDTVSLSKFSDQNPDTIFSIDSSAYCIFTSGSTGRPNGVDITHRSLANLSVMMDQLLEDSTLPLERWAWNASFSFDSCLKVFIQLLKGRRIYILDEELRLDPEKLVCYLQENSIDVIDGTPSLVECWLDEATRQGSSLPSLLIGGENISSELWCKIAKYFSSTNRSAFNLYGTTECTVDTTAVRIEEGDLPSIGYPLANAECFILDKSFRPVPIGIVGELFVGGVSVSQGYINQPKLTCERFINLNISALGERRLYRTGDSARWCNDGRIEWCGRLDSQLKIRGNRVDLSEVEAVLGMCDGVKGVAVVARESEIKDIELVAFIVWKNSGFLEGDSKIIRGELRRVIPEFMIPSLIRSLDEFPLSPNGKIDRNALLAIDLKSGNDIPLKDSAKAVDESAELTDTQRKLVMIWEKCLGHKRFALNDSLFDIGGDSLIAVKVTALFRDAFPIRLTVRQLYKSSTINKLAKIVEGASN